jgi:hypothetical protein
MPGEDHTEASIERYDAGAVSVIRSLNDLADKGASKFLFVVGGLIVAFGLASKTDMGLAKLTPEDFLAVLILGALLMALATFVSLYEFKKIHDEARDIRQGGKRVLEAGQETLARGQEQSQTVAERRTA